MGWLQVYDMMKQLGIHADLLTYNLLLGFCRIKGNWQTAFQLFEEMNLKAVAPNMFTYMTLIEVSNYRGAGRCHEALYAFRALLNAGEPVPDYVEEELVRCVENGCAKTDLKGALQIFAKMEAVGMSKSTRTYNAVLAACAGAGEWVAALDIYACMVQEGVTADTASYNAVLQVPPTLPPGGCHTGAPSSTVRPRRGSLSYKYAHTRISRSRSHCCRRAPPLVRWTALWTFSSGWQRGAAPISPWWPTPLPTTS
jgi:pentatricopeptide repeat protein